MGVSASNSEFVDALWRDPMLTEYQTWTRYLQLVYNESHGAKSPSSVQLLYANELLGGGVTLPHPSPCFHFGVTGDRPCTQWGLPSCTLVCSIR